MADTHIKIKPVTPRVQYTANGSTTVFPYSFAIFDDSDMVVYVDDNVITTGYTVSGAGQTDGGNVTFDSAPVDGTIITLLRNVPIERMTDFQEGGTFRPKNLNDEFDRQTAFAQQVQEALGRAVKVDPTSESNPEEILPKIERLYDSADNIDIVANDKANVDAVAENQTNIDECADNMAAIQAAPTAAGNAASSASAAATSAEKAAISAAGTHFKLFHHDWFDYQLNDMAWLRADTFSWQDGTVYSNAYNHLVDDATNGTSQTETIAGHTITYTLAEDGHKIVQAANASAVEGLYNDTGVAWYYILDLVNHRFKLPRTKYGFTGLRDTVGKYVPESLPDYVALTGHNGTGQYRQKSVEYNYTANVAQVDTATTSSSDTSYGSQVDVFTYRPVQQRSTQMYLYFYVGQFSQSATEQTAGLNSSLFNGKADIDMGNVPNNIGSTAKSYFSDIDAPSSVYEDIAVGASGATYEAPASGYFVMFGNFTNQASYVQLGDGNGNIISSITPGYQGYSSLGTSLRVKKGYNMPMYYSNVTFSLFRFVYAEGEV